jgi:hypothetical protein
MVGLDRGFAGPGVNGQKQKIEEIIAACGGGCAQCSVKKFMMLYAVTRRPSDRTAEVSCFIPCALCSRHFSTGKNKAECVMHWLTAASWIDWTRNIRNGRSRFMGQPTRTV